MKNFSILKQSIFISTFFVLFLAGCSKNSVETEETLIKEDKSSEIAWLEKTSKTKFFRKNVEVSDKSGQSKVILRVASISETELDTYLKTRKLSLETFGSMDEFNDFASSYKTPSINETKIVNNSNNSEAISGIHVEVVSKAIDSKVKYYVFRVKSISDIVNSKNLRPNYNGQDTYYSSDGANNGTARAGLDPGGTNCYVSFYVRNCWLCSYHFDDAKNLYAPGTTPTWTYSYKGKLIINWYEEDYWYFI
jgi:hypothetical protein